MNINLTNDEVSLLVLCCCVAAEKFDQNSKLMKEIQNPRLDFTFREQAAKARMLSSQLTECME